MIRGVSIMRKMLCTCDRCGAELENNFAPIHMLIYRNVNLSTDSTMKYGCSNVKSMDLCTDCSEAFNDFMNKKHGESGGCSYMKNKNPTTCQKCNTTLHWSQGIVECPNCGWWCFDKEHG